MRRGILIGAAMAAMLGSGAAQAQAPADDAALRAEIAQLEARVALLARLKALREQHAALEAEAPAGVETTTIPAAPETPLEVGAPKSSSTSSGGASSASIAPPGGTSFESSIGGVRLGVGLGFTYDLGNNDRVKAATVINGVVRVTESDNVRARLLLESHYFFTPSGRFLGLGRGDWGIGPFVAVQGGPSDVIAGIGAGMMIGLKRLRASSTSVGKSAKPEAQEDGSSFNIGVGIFYDLGVQTLGDGIEANKPLPEGETEIRFSQRSQSGLMILSSFAF